MFAQLSVFKNFGLASGLPQSQVNCLFQDSLGYLWAGTRGGLARFDGRRFESYFPEDGTPGFEIQSICEFRNRLWIAGDKGVAYSDYNEFRTAVATGGAEFLCVVNDRLLIAGNAGLALLEGDDESGYALRSIFQEPVFACFSDRDTVWLGTAGGIRMLRFTPEMQPEYSELPKSDGLVNALLKDKHGVFWVGYYGNGLRRNGIERIPGLKGEIPSCILDDGDRIWVGTIDKGLTQLDRQGNFLAHFDDAGGLPGNQISCLLKDVWGNLWIGTSGGGLSCYAPSGIRHLHREHGLPGRAVYSVQSDSSGTLWVGSGEKGLIRYFPAGGEVERDSVLDNLKVKALFLDSLGRIWAGTEGGGIRIYGKDKVWELSARQGLAGAWIKDICFDRQGDVWVASSGGGISRIYPGSRQRPGDIEVKRNYLMELRSQRIKVLCSDKSGRMWFGTEGSGMGYILPDETVVSFGTQEGFGASEVSALCNLNDQWLWIGTAEGLYRLDLRNESSLPLQLPKNFQPAGGNIYLIESDPFGNVWVGDRTGVYRITTDEKGEPSAMDYFGPKEGFIGKETCTNAALRGDDGLMYFGTVEGLHIVDPTIQVSGPTGVPRSFFTSVSLLYVPLKETRFASDLDARGLPKKPLVLTYTQNHLSFGFSALHLSSPDEIQYQWVLEGLDSVWTPLSSLNNATFSNLKPGDYTFRFRACLGESGCGEPRSIAFTILRPFWQETWFYWVSALSLALISLGSFRVYLRQVQRRSRERNEKLRMQNELLELESKALRLQMNPHFIFNALASVQGLIAEGEYKDARMQLSLFSRLMRQILENSRKERISISDEVKALENYLEIERQVRSGSFDFTVQVEPGCADFLIPPLLIQPFAENAIVHGFSGLRGRGLLSLRIFCDEVYLTIFLEDNGIGREAAARKKSDFEGRHTSAGLAVTGERLGLLGGNNKAHVTFTDLYDSGGEARGTRVEIRIPLDAV